MGIEEDDDDLFEGIYNERPLTSQEAASVSSQGNAEGGADDYTNTIVPWRIPGTVVACRQVSDYFDARHVAQSHPAAADAGCIHVNGRAVKRNYRVKPGDVVTFDAHSSPF